MVDYKKLYFFLFNRITDVINDIEEADRKGEDISVKLRLKLIQMNAEELYLRQGDEEEKQE